MFSILILGWSAAISSKELLGVMRKMGQNHTDDELISLNRSWSIGQLFEDMFCESFSSFILDFDILILHFTAGHHLCILTGKLSKYLTQTKMVLSALRS